MGLDGAGGSSDAQCGAPFRAAPDLVGRRVYFVDFTQAEAVRGSTREGFEVKRGVGKGATIRSGAIGLLHCRLYAF
ncbi:hypothetical protein PSAB6_270064 [Paraburkholderia sabiae]|nr:hypothetical protein PSAB6_270064 [Paraburkholderia sabiae]